MGTSRRSIGTRIAAFTATGLLVAGMTACGSDDDDDDAPTDDPVESVLEELPAESTPTT